jgi:hypothetical protein
VFVLVLALLTRRPTYECPPGKSIAATVKRHSDAGPLLVALEAAGIDTQIVDEPAKSLWRRLPFLLVTVYRAHEPPGPWHVIVPSNRLAEAQRLLGVGLEGQGGAPRLTGTST